MSIRSLQYVGVRSPRAAQWRTFGPEVLGMEPAPDETDDGAVRLRMDGCTRLIVHPGEVDELAYLGWDVGDPDGLTTVTDRLQAIGVDVDVRPTGPVDRRSPDPVATFVDPWGFHHELAFDVSPETSIDPTRSTPKFVTGDLGLGHVALMVPDVSAVERFYIDTMGFRLSDSLGDPPVVCFLHCNARHHTIALASAAGRHGLLHLMVEVASVDDVGIALDNVNRREVPLALTLGRHTNDLMISFYIQTPSGFEIEYGTGGLLIDDATWQIATHQRASRWGHRSPSTVRP